MIKVSVTVPVYNAEPYLRQCLDSLAAQTLREVEFILVDDGSTDGSGAVCDEYAARDARFRVFHQPNGGSASARQTGLDHVQGEYYTVCDSDDWVEPTMYEELYNKAVADDADIVVSDLMYNYSDGSTRVIPGNKGPMRYDLYLRNVISGAVGGNTCSKLFRNSILRKYQIAYKQGINQGEDALFMLNVLLHPVRITYLPKAFYHYRRELGGNTYTNRPTMASFRQIEYIHKWKHEHFNVVEYEKELFFSTINRAFTALRIPDFPISEYKELVQRELPYAQFFKYHAFSLKALLVLFSKMSFPATKLVFRLSYKIFYR